MIKKIICALLTVCTFTAFAEVTYPKYPSPYFVANKAPLRVLQNQTFHLLLKSNPETGYSWHWISTPFDKNLVTLVGHEYIDAAKAKKDPFVEAGRELWTFRAKSGPYRVIQVGHIVMQYSHPGKKSKITKKFIVYVSTKALCPIGESTIDGRKCMQGSQ